MNRMPLWSETPLVSLMAISRLHVCGSAQLISDRDLYWHVRAFANELAVLEIFVQSIPKTLEKTKQIEGTDDQMLVICTHQKSQCCSQRPGSELACETVSVLSRMPMRADQKMRQMPIRPVKKPFTITLP